MNKMLQYSLPNLIKAYNENKDLIIAYQSGKSVEGYVDPSGKSNINSNAVMGLSIGLFIGVLVISLVLWIWGLILMIMYWNILADWAKAVGIIGLLIGFPVATIVVGYAGQKK